MNPLDQELVGSPSKAVMEARMREVFAPPPPTPKISFGDRIPSNAITAGYTYDDARARRAEIEAEQTNKRNFDSFLSNVKSGGAIDTSLYQTPPSAEQENVIAQQRAGLQSYRDVLGGAMYRDTAGQRERMYKEAGVPQLQENLGASNMRIAGIQGDMAQLRPSIETEAGQTRLGAEARIAPVQRQLTAELNAEALVNSALVGNLELKQSTVQQILDDQFKDEENNINLLKAQVDTLAQEAQTYEPAMKAEAERRATLLNMAIQERETVVAQARANREQAMNIAMTALENGAPADVVKSALASGIGPTQMLGAVGGYLGPQGGGSGGGGVAGVSSEAQNIIDLINRGANMDDLIKGSSNASQQLRNEVIAGLAAQGGYTEQVRELFQEGLDVVQTFLNNEDYKKLGGYSAKIGGQFTPGYGDAKQRADQIISILTKDNLGLMKGVLTDRDIEFLKSMSAGFTGEGLVSEGFIKEKMIQIGRKFEERLKSFEQASATPTTPQQDTSEMAFDEVLGVGMFEDVPQENRGYFSNLISAISGK